LFLFIKKIKIIIGLIFVQNKTRQSEVIINLNEYYSVLVQSLGLSVLQDPFVFLHLLELLTKQI